MKAVYNNNSISRASTNLLKIFFEALVLLHHLTEPSTEFGKMVDGLIGPVGVAGFLFLSGYGIGISFKNKGQKYVENLCKKRIPRMYLIIVVTDLFYVILFLLKGNKFENLLGLVSSILYIPLFSSYVTLSHWLYFVADLAIYYVMFVVMAMLLKKCKNRLRASAFGVLCLDAILIIVLSIINAKTGSSRHMRACLMFPLGLFFADLGKNSTNFIKVNKYKFSAITFVLGCLFCFIDSPSLSEYLITSLFALTVISLFLGVEFKSDVVDVVSKHVIFVYLSHEFFYKMLLHFVPSWNALLFFEITIIYAVTFAIIAKKKFPKVEEWVKIFYNKNKPKLKNILVKKKKNSKEEELVIV